MEDVFSATEDESGRSIWFPRCKSLFFRVQSRVSFASIKMSTKTGDKRAHHVRRMTASTIFWHMPVPPPVQKSTFPRKISSYSTHNVERLACRLHHRFCWNSLQIYLEHWIGGDIRCRFGRRMCWMRGHACAATKDECWCLLPMWI
jgi:hypothetical protein